MKKRLIPIWFIAIAMLILSGCSKDENLVTAPVVDANPDYAFTEGLVTEGPPNKDNNYGFSGDFLSVGNVMVYYPVTDDVKDALVPYKKKSVVEKELLISKPKKWMLLESENDFDTILIEIDKNDLKVLVYEEGQATPSSCEVALGDGNFLNFSKLVAYKKYDILYIYSEYPTSSSYEALYFYKKGKEIKLLESQRGDKVLDTFKVLKNHIAFNETDLAIEGIKKVQIAYPELYLEEIIDINKLFFYHLTEKAKTIQETDAEKALEYYQLALQLVIMTEIGPNEDSAYLAYDVAMKASEENPEISNQLIDNKNIAEVINRYIKLLKYKDLPVNEYLLDLSKILNNTLK